MKKDPNSALTAGGVIFLLVALIHLSRLVLKFDIAINQYQVPLNWNVAGLAVSSLMSLWMFRSRI